MHKSHQMPELTRRELLMGAAALAAVTPGMMACAPDASHENIARELRRPIGSNTSDQPLLQSELVRYSTLAPSSHNTQCWKFRVQPGSITIEPDLLRRCPVVDPDDHHMFVSLGCATENLAHAALANGLQADAQYNAAGAGAVEIRLEATKATASPLFQAIAERQCTRADYDGKPLSSDELQLMERAGSGKGVHVLLLTERAAMERVLEYVVAGNTVQLNDAAFVTELKAWIRFSADEAESTGDGLFAGTTGAPVMPRWLGARLMSLFVTAESENERCASQVRSSGGIAVFASDASNKAHWIEAGRCYERFALQATALGLRNAFLNQPVEVGAIRSQFASALGLGGQRPDLVVRFGRGPSMPQSMRRPVQAVFV